MHSKKPTGKTPDTSTSSKKTFSNTSPNTMNYRSQTNTSSPKPQIPTPIKSPKINSHSNISTPSQTVINNKDNARLAASHKTTSSSPPSPHLINNKIAASAAAATAVPSTAISTCSNAISTTSISNQDGQYISNNTHQTQTIITPSNPTYRNFASITANCITPKRDQALVFNSIDGVPQKDYVLAIGQIVSPKNIIFVSRISNNRFCIFLSNKSTLDALMEKTKSITINNQEIQLRRLINPAKRIIISNVCPSISNHEILNVLKGIDITPTSQINYLKAGLNIEGYEHILSFRRQMYINHEDIPKLPGTLIINSNGSLFRIFLTDDSITCYTCKSTGHTSNTCKKEFLNDLNFQPPHNPNSILTHENPQKEVTISIENTKSSQHLVIHDTSYKEDTHHPVLPPTNATLLQNIMDWSVENHDETPSALLTHDNTEQNLIEQSTYSLLKRPLSDTNTPKSPNSPTISGDKMPIPQPDKKKPKIKSRSNSLTSLEDNKVDSMLKPAVAFFANSENTSITMEQFKFFLENIGNNKINIHTLCEEINSNVSSMFDLLENIRPLITERSMKAKLKKTSNLLFKVLPPQ